MKRLLSFMMALILVLSLGVTAFADENTATGSGSITITNATKNEIYNLYHIFDATYSVDADGDADSVLYTIDPEDQFYTYMFGTDGKTENPYFTLNENGVVEKNENVKDADIITYLTDMVRSEEDDFDPFKFETANGAELVFSGLPYGYYLIDKGVGASVTIDSNTPDVEVIDKNQAPGTVLNKLVKDDTGDYVTGNTASVGDMVDYKVNFTATNYDGEALVKYYTITDVKDPALWVEFEDIRVVVDGDELENGYYYCANDEINTDEWDYLGTWESGDPSDADWYLIQYTLDKFEIVIPWLDDYTFEGKQDSAQGYELTFDLDENDNDEILSESMFSSPAVVELYYKAAVGAAAAGSTVENSATLNWVSTEGKSNPVGPETAETTVYNLGVTKIAKDGTDEQEATRLAGAVFELYKDQACTQPIYVILTNNTGVYVLDDVDTEISGTNRETSREVYAGCWQDYIDGTEEDPNPNGSGNKRQDMITPENGQLVILGLKAGTYYLKETKAPVGYNELPVAQEVTVGPGGDADTYTDSSYKNLEGEAISFLVSEIEVVNNKGIELPSTGGEGTMLLVTIGTMIAMAFAVLLITHKKMSVYED